MAAARRHSITPAAITVAGNSGSLTNLGENASPVLVVFLRIAGPVTGTSPSLTVSIDGSPDGTNWASIGAFSAQTAVTAAGVAVRLALSNVLDPNIRASWTVSGTTPSFGGVDIEIFMASPDA